MALILCPECKKEISNQCTLCPQCGYPIITDNNTKLRQEKTNKKSSVLIIVLIFVILILSTMLFVILTNNHNSQNYKNTSERLSIHTTEDYLDVVYANFIEEQEKLVDSLINFGDFETESDIKNFELTWTLAIDTFNKNIETLTTYKPAEEYEVIWNELLTNITELKNHCEPFTDLDTNNDNVYTSAEGDKIYNDNVSFIKDSIIKTAEVCKDYILEKTILSVPENTTQTNEISTISKETQVCIECGESATKIYSNPFSNEIEHYCQTHYNEIIDIIGGMEEDVGDSEYSTHKCEECSKEGTHKYESFTGQTEYYCTKHYEELKDLLNSFGLD